MPDLTVKAPAAELPDALKTQLLTLLAQPPHAVFADLSALYYALTPADEGACFLFLVARNQYEEIEYFLQIRPDIDVSQIVNAAGDTALHIAFSAREVDFSLIALLHQRNLSLAKKNGKQVTPLQLCFALPKGEAILSDYCNKYSAEWSLDFIQDIFEESIRRHFFTVSYYLLSHFQEQLRVTATLDANTGHRVMHVAALATPVDFLLLYELIRQGASWQDKQDKTDKRAAKTPLDLLLESNDAERIISVATEFATALTIDQHFKVQSTLFLRDVALCERLLLAHSRNADIEKEYIVKTLDALMHTNSKLSAQGMKNILASLIRTRGNDLSLLKYVMNTTGDKAIQKQVLAELVQQMQARLIEADSIIALVNTLEEMTHATTVPNLNFLRERTQVSLHGHAWKGEPACGTWVSLMQAAQARVKELVRGAMTDAQQQFVKLTTTQRFGYFSPGRSLESISPPLGPVVSLLPPVSPLH